MLGAVVPIYNLPGVNTELKFSPDVLADIYLGKITNWNDARIAKDNPGVKLPDSRHHRRPPLRWQRHHLHLHRLSFQGQPRLEEHRRKNTAVPWPMGIGGKGNEGVAGMVRQLPGTIGYVELIYALQNKIPFGYIKNAAGNWVKGSIDGVTEAAASVKQMPADYRVSITNAPGKNAYPISSFTWLLIPTPAAGRSQGKVIKDFLNWMLDQGRIRDQRPLLRTAAASQSREGSRHGRPAEVATFECPSLVGDLADAPDRWA